MYYDICSSKKRKRGLKNVTQLFSRKIEISSSRENMLQQDLAEHLKVSKSTVSGWEVGRNQPNYDTLIELSIFFGVSVDYLIGRRNY